MKDHVNILSIDGGGIRGIIPAVILAAIEQEIGEPLHAAFHVICGTSTGGIIALAIGAQRAKDNRAYEAAELIDLYSQNGAQIFAKNPFTYVRRFFRPQYSPAALEQVLQTYFGDTMFGAALTPLLIPTYDLVSQTPFFFKSHRVENKPDYNLPLRVIARATSAAPTFFPPIRTKYGGSECVLIDGGVCVNNPAMAAYAEARLLYPEAKDFLVISVGTGSSYTQDSEREAMNAEKWGPIRWARQIPRIMMDSASVVISYEFGATAVKVHRLQPILRFASPEMDNADPSNIQRLIEDASSFLNAVHQELQLLCKRIKRTTDISEFPSSASPH